MRLFYYCLRVLSRVTDFNVDNEQDIIFIRSAIIIDTHKLDKIGDFLDNIYKDPHQSSYLDLLIHEQYFFPHFSYFLIILLIIDLLAAISSESSSLGRGPKSLYLLFNAVSRR